MAVPSVAYDREKMSDRHIIFSPTGFVWCAKTDSQHEKPWNVPFQATFISFLHG